MQQLSGRMAPARPSSPAIGNQYEGPEIAGEPVVLAPDSVINAACSAPDGWAGAAGFGAEQGRFSKKLDQAMQLALQRARRGG